MIAAIKGIEAFFVLTEEAQSVTDGMKETLDIFCNGLLVR